MSHLVDFKNVSEVGLETSPVATALAGLRANEARYFHNKYKAEFVTTPVTKSKEVLKWVNTILKEERNIVIA
ncbi:MAG: phage tail protein, partial [Bacteroidota bacterium]